MTVSTEFAARLVESRPIAPDVRHCVFELQEAPLRFRPGQHVLLSAQLEGSREERYYSLASSPDEPGFALCAKTDIDPFSRLLAAPNGRRFGCQGPSGSFGLRQELRDSLFVAAGTGVAPLRAMLRHLLGRRDRSHGRRLVLLQGARSPQSLLYGDEFRGLAERRERFVYLPTISGHPEWQGRHGRVQTHLEEASRLFDGPFDAYVCGGSAMVADTARALIAVGLDEGAIFFERL